jgi:hypothetical protein
MGLKEDIHQDVLRAAGWTSRGYLPHFDDAILPQFITYHLADALPLRVIQRRKKELREFSFELERILLQRRVKSTWTRDTATHGWGICEWLRWFRTRLLS